MLAINCALERGAFTLDVAFEAPGAAVTALFGRSGSGKTTLISVLSGLLTPERGRITFDGETLLDTTRGIDLPAESRALGYVFQDGRLFPHLSVQGNLDYGLKRARQRPGKIGLASVVELLGLGALLQRRVAGLSGGERQRVALGRALLMQPRALLLDEPLASLDAARKDEVLPYFERLRDEHRLPIIYVSHSFDEVLRLAEHVVILEAGRVAAHGSVSAICLEHALHAIVGEGVMGVLLQGEVTGHDAAERLASVRCGTLELRIASRGAVPKSRVRLYVPADNVVLARARPQAISTRNVFEVEVVRLEMLEGSLLARVNAGDTTLLARITQSAAAELELEPGVRCFALVKAVAAQGIGIDRRGQLRA